MLLPDNFLYFITLFSLSIICGTYLLSSYNRNRLVLINALAFFFVALRASSEFYLPQIENYHNAVRFVTIHSLFGQIIITCIWLILWFYIKPFQGWKWKKLGNAIFLWLVLIIPSFPIVYGLLIRRFYTLSTEKIDGYWQFATNLSTIDSIIYFSYMFYFMYPLTIVLMLVELFRNKKNRFYKLIVLIAFLVLPPLFSKYLLSTSTNQWLIPNVAGVYFLHVFFLSWFVSNYRLFQDSFSKTVKDLLDSISDLAFYTDINLKIEHINELSAKQFSEKIINENFVETLANVSQQTANQLKVQIDALIKQKETEKEVYLIFEEGEKTYNLKVAKFQQGNIHLGYTFLLSDLTKIKQKEIELTQLNTTKDRLFAIIGHDLRKPALAFRGISKKVNFLIQQKEFDTLDKLGKNLESAAFSLNSLLDNLLNWALKQRDVLPYDPKPVNVKEATEEIFNLFQQIADDKGITLKLDIAEATHAFSDQNALTTIIRNLVDNAIKYTPKGGFVEVTSEKKPTGILVIIKDSGTGITANQLDNLFELQKNKSKRGTEGETGSGLGLALVKDLIALNKGEINVHSVIGNGTTFEILLPAA